MPTLKPIHLFLFVIFLLAAAGCSSIKEDKTELSGKGVYFWRTNFSLSENETDFLKRNDIERLYVHFFDVVIKENKWMPEATLHFTSPFPDHTEIIPTVFIDSKALTLSDPISALAPLILGRVDSMMTKNGYDIAREIQIDFDWAPSNQERYFSLLSQLKDSLAAKQRTLSATIRLHQLSQSPPPVDYGVLMAYNMGHFKNRNEINSIISIPTLKKYISPLKDYPLSLRPALPIYSWNIIFHDGKFLAIARDLDLNDTLLFSPADGNHYIVKSYMPLPVGSSGADPSGRLYPGDIIRHEGVSPEILDSALDILNAIKPGINDGLILYHLNENSINSFSDYEIKEIYNRL